MDALNLKPQLIILGDVQNSSQSILDFIQEVRARVSKSIIIHVATISESISAVNSIKAGASEFIEKNSATFVRLRTSLDLLEKKAQAGGNSIITNLKKVFMG